MRYILLCFLSKGWKTFLLNFIGLAVKLYRVCVFSRLLFWHIDANGMNENYFIKCFPSRRFLGIIHQSSIRTLISWHRNGLLKLSKTVTMNTQNWNTFDEGFPKIMWTHYDFCGWKPEFPEKMEWWRGNIDPDEMSGYRSVCV